VPGGSADEPRAHRPTGHHSGLLDRPREGDAEAGRLVGPPLLGEHTDEVLAGLGYDADTIARLHAEDVVR
jgi:crotonobetainyl-CoA:carnitine CoA-transferase CaiB-like acyl-CoA transferase